MYDLVFVNSLVNLQISFRKYSCKFTFFLVNILANLHFLSRTYSCTFANLSCRTWGGAHLLDEDGEPLVLEGLGELDVLSALVVDGEGGHDHVGQAAQQLAHHPVPLLLVAVVHLEGERERERTD